MQLASPAWLLVLVPVASLGIIYLLQQIRRRRYAARFSAEPLQRFVVPRRPGWRRHLTFVLLLLALAVLSIGVARPTAEVRVARDRATVMLAIDVSRSMKATDVLPDRITAAETAAKQFADQLPPRINLGLVKFAGSASVLVPPTIDRDAFKLAVANLSLDDSTAIGDAIFSSLDSIAAFSKSSTAKGDAPAPARIVLLSDGTSNKGRSVSSAVAAAVAAKTPVSTIAFGTAQGSVDIDGEGSVAVPVDSTTLNEIATETGGSFHTATSAEQLKSVYANIGSQIGYTTARHDIAWRFLAVGALLALAAAASSLLWAGRLT
ncbi:MAG: VWA domain-containing protein [Actinobacteria bacterium]|nr:VWA domain-containing protein [Actinomycetota bacterium]